MTTRSPLTRWALLLGAALAIPGLTSCATPQAHGPAAATSCAAVVQYRGHDYWAHRELMRDPETTGRLVQAVVPSCDDSGGQRSAEPERHVRVAELADVPLDTAVLLDGSVYVREGRRLPSSTEAWFRSPRCTTDGVFELTGDWLGVSGPRKPRFDGDVRPPYRLEVHVTRGPESYVGTRLRLHADRHTDPLLGARDVKASLWHGGRVAARTTCEDGRFRAVALWVPDQS